MESFEFNQWLSSGHWCGFKKRVLKVGVRLLSHAHFFFFLEPIFCMLVFQLSEPGERKTARKQLVNCVALINPYRRLNLSLFSSHSTLVWAVKVMLKKIRRMSKESMEHHTKHQEVAHQAVDSVPWDPSLLQQLLAGNSSALACYSQSIG